jgi:hypothetical protein
MLADEGQSIGTPLIIKTKGRYVQRLVSNLFLFCNQDPNFETFFSKSLMSVEFIT